MAHNMKVLVTGGAGFIGRHVVETLQNEGAEVVVFDSLVTGNRMNVPESASFIEGDIRDVAVVASAMEGATHVVHLAALVSVPLSIENPKLTEEVNVEGTKNIFAAAKAAGVTRIVYASSAAVYGNEPSVPKREDSPIVPESPYAESKAKNDDFAGTHEVSSMGLRFFNVYGPGQVGNHPYASVVPRWIETIKANMPLTVFGDGSQTRDFIHVRDVARAVALALSSSVRGVANIGSGTERPLKDLLGILSAEAGCPLEISYLPARPGDILRSFADITRAKKELGFAPSISLEKGIGELFRQTESL